ncbi:MAG: tetratricopeptide repeat protein [Acidimicrobiales bacterium]
MTAVTDVGRENELELRSLTTMAKLATGFTLGFVVTNQPRLADSARHALAAAVGEEGVGVLRLTAGDDDLLVAIRGAAGARSLLVTGVEELLDPKGEKRSLALGQLNLDRVALPAACPVPLVFVCARWALRELIRSASDVWSWRSGLYRLRGDAEAIDEAVSGLVFDGSSDERPRRVTQRVLHHLLDEVPAGDAGLRLQILLRLGGIETGFGSYDEADDAYRRALAISTDLGDRMGEANSLRGLADTSMLRDRYDEADDAYRQALAIATDLGDRLGEAYASRGVGQVSLAQGRPAEAGDAFRRAETLFRQLGMTEDAADVAERLTSLEAKGLAPPAG